MWSDLLTIGFPCRMWDVMRIHPKEWLLRKSFECSVMEQSSRSDYVRVLEDRQRPTQDRRSFCWRRVLTIEIFHLYIYRYCTYRNIIGQAKPLECTIFLHAFCSFPWDLGGDNTFEKAPPTHDLNVYSKHINIHTHTDICNLYLLYPSIRVCSRNFSQSISGKYLQKTSAPNTSA